MADCAPPGRSARRLASLVLTTVAGTLALTAAAPAATRDLTREAAAACRPDPRVSAACTATALGSTLRHAPSAQSAADPWKGAASAQSAADPWKGAGGEPADPWGQNGTPRFAADQPIVGDYALIDNDGNRHAVVRVRQRRDFSYSGVIVEPWITSGGLRSQTCDLKPGGNVWWDINPNPDALSTWTFESRSYLGSSIYISARTFSEDPDGVGRVECDWDWRPWSAELRFFNPTILVWPDLSWKKLDHGGPVVKAHPGSGVPGGKFSVSFTAAEPDGWASFYVQIYHRGDLVAGAIYEVEVPIGMSTTLTAHGNLDEREDSHLKWCVTAYDAAENKRSDCARLRTTSCHRAKQQLGQANKAVAKAKRKLRQATPGELKKAKRKLRQAKKGQAKKRAAKKQACRAGGSVNAPGG